MSRILSLVISLIYLLISFISEDMGSSLQLLLFLIFPLACIWFGEDLGNWMGTIGLHPVTSPSPGYLVKLMGWILLLLPAIIWIILVATSSK